jgi:hypothetical protein
MVRREPFSDITCIVTMFLSLVCGCRHFSAGFKAFTGLECVVLGIRIGGS